MFSGQVLLRDPAFPFIHLLVVVKKIETLNLARRQVAIFDPLAHLVLVNRLTKVFEIICG